MQLHENCSCLSKIGKYDDLKLTYLSLTHLYSKLQNLWSKKFHCCFSTNYGSHPLVVHILLSYAMPSKSVNSLMWTASKATCLGQYGLDFLLALKFMPLFDYYISLPLINMFVSYFSFANSALRPKRKEYQQRSFGSHYIRCYYLCHCNIFSSHISYCRKIC
jgi:hypothetical protein